MKRTAKDAAKISALILDSGFAVSLAADKAHAAGIIPPAERAEIAARVAINADVLALISKHGLDAVLASVQHAAEMARDVEEEDSAPRIVHGILTFGNAIAAARAVIS